MLRASALVLMSLLLFAASAPASAEGPLDEGMLDLAWFGGELEFREARGVDYLWVKPGFTLEGRTLRFAPWQEAEFLGAEAAERDAEDKKLAAELTQKSPVTFSRAFKFALGTKVQLVDSGEQITAVGRIVDCSTGAAAAKFLVGMGAGAGSITFDLKFQDARSGELLAALHHRAVSAHASSTTESKLLNWVNELAAAIEKQGLAKLYDKGKRTTE